MLRCISGIRKIRITMPGARPHSVTGEIASPPSCQLTLAFGIQGLSLVSSSPLSWMPSSPLQLLLLHGSLATKTRFELSFRCGRPEVILFDESKREQ